MPVGVLPIPHNAPHFPERPRNATPCLSFVGTAYRDRGFYLLPHVVSHLLPAIVAGQARFEIQAQLPPWSDPLLDNACAMLRQSPVILHEKSLSLDEYHGIFLRSDIALIPSSRNQYHVQTSGVFSEAVCFGKIPIVPADTWMSLMAETYNIGVTFEAGNPGSLCRAVDKALEQRDVLSERSMAAAPEWNRVNSPLGLITALAERMPYLLPN
jgi:hypothetical protein